MKTRTGIIGVAVMGCFIFAGNLSFADSRHWDRHESRRRGGEHGVRSVGISGEYARPDCEQTYVYREKVVVWGDGCRDCGQRHHMEKMHDRPRGHIYHAQCSHGHGPGKHYRHCVPVRHSPPCRRECRPVILGGFFSGLIARPGWAVWLDGR